MANLPALTPTNFTEAMAFAEALAKSTMVPPAFQKNPANILLAIQWGQEIGLGVMQALQNIAVINGRPAVYGDAMLALVRGSPVCEDVIEHIERGDSDNRIAVCEARRKGSAPVVAKFSINDAKRAGLWGKSGPWSQYPARMLQMRARGFALRDAFPDVLRGIISAEEAGDYPRQAKDVTPASLSAELDAFAEAQESAPIPEPPEYAAAEDGAPVPASTPERPRQDDDLPQDDGRLSSGGSDAPLVVKVPRKNRGWDWAGYANELLAVAQRLEPDQFADFRAANAQMINSLRISNKEEWSRVQQELAEMERGEEP